MTFSWGVVHTVSPLTVIEDGSSNALPVIQSLVDPSSLTVGDMVRVELAQGGRVVVYGLPGGDPRVGIPFAMATGTVGVGAYDSFSGNIYWGVQQTITFPSGRFTQTPAVSVDTYNAGVGWAMLDSAPNQNSFTCRAIRVATAPVGTITWTAIQMTEDGFG